MLPFRRLYQPIAALSAGASDTNNIGTPGAVAFGVGVCPSPPAGFAALAGTADPTSSTYGNYQYTDGSIMVWIPAFYYKFGTGANGLAVNAIDIKRYSAYANEAAANADSYALHRAFYDNGAVQLGVFVDKYLCSNNGGTASSIALGNPLSSAAGNNPFSGLTGTPSDTYAGAIAAAKTRGSIFFCNSRFIHAALAMLSYAHGQASSSTTNCAWWHATNNFPKGNNNNASLNDVNDTGLTFTLGSYNYQTKTGSGSVFAKTTHNGQNSGVCDLHGNLWEINPGLTSNGSTLYILKTTARMRDVTGGNTLATDLFGATGIAALYDSLGATFGAATASSTQKTWGNAAQVLSEATSGDNWKWAGFGGPLAGGVGGTNAFGNDGFWDYRPNEMCPVSGGNWNAVAASGVWTLGLHAVRGGSSGDVGFRAASYL